MRRAFSTLGCPDLGLDAVLALACAHGLGGVELRGLAGTLDLPAHLAGRFGQPPAFARHVAAGGVAVVSLDTSVRLLTHTAEDRATLLAYGAWAHGAGVPALRLFDGGERAGVAEIAHAAGLLGWWHDARAERGWTVTLMVETHDALANPGGLGRFVAALPQAALLWDAHHTWRRGGEDPLRTLARIGRQVAHIHVKDSVTDAARPAGYRYVLPGEGEFPMRPLMERLASERYGGVLSLEWERLWHPDLPPLDDALRAAGSGWW